MTNDEICAAVSADQTLLDYAHADPINTQAIADALSTGRQRLVPTEIGVGTILETLKGVGSGGGVFLDTLTSIGTANRDVYWTMVLINKGTLRIDKPAVRAGMQELAAAVPPIQPEIDALLALGYVDDPITEFQVRCALLNDDGTSRV